jgi:hypothetical protein
LWICPEFASLGQEALDFCVNLTENGNGFMMPMLAQANLGKIAKF